jgi:hypothetical protein
MVDLNDDRAIERFDNLTDAWLTQLADGWWAYYGDECPIGPFNTKAEAARAGLREWTTTTSS